VAHVLLFPIAPRPVMALSPRTPTDRPNIRCVNSVLNKSASELTLSRTLPVLKCSVLFVTIHWSLILQVPMSSQPKIDHSPEADLSMDVVFPSSRWVYSVAHIQVESISTWLTARTGLEYAHVLCLWSYLVGPCCSDGCNSKHQVDSI
jgi:hypothetical protein